MTQSLNIREISPDDDFVAIARFMRETGERNRSKIGLNIIACATDSPQQAKRMFYTKKGERHAHVQGFVAERNGVIVALLGVFLDPSGNAAFNFGYEEQFEYAITPLLDKGIEAVRQRGGEEIVINVTLLHGQVNNELVQFWSQFGFVPDFYYTVMLCKEFDEAGEATADSQLWPSCSLQEVHQWLLQENEGFVDSLMKDHTEQESVCFHLVPVEGVVEGIACYHEASFKHFRKGTDEKFDALGAFNIVIQFDKELSLPEKKKAIRDFLTLLSARQVNYAHFRLLSRDYQVITLLLQEGFDYFAPVCDVALRRKV